MAIDSKQSTAELRRELEEMRARLQEAEEVLNAIGRGEVDAIMVTGDRGDQVALILTPVEGESKPARTLGQSKSAQYVARSVRVGEVDRLVRRNRDQAEHGNRGIDLGISASARHLQEMVQSAADNDSPILLQGETGTGKGVIARWIYEHGNRRRAPFVEINCAGLKGDLLANELFGHERGAFTSAVDSRPGLLDVANGGTLFLDEIGDMDLGVQSQFLKVLEEKRFRKLGAVAEQHIEFRLICATNRNLHEEIRAGRFRNDLFYRIHVFPLEVPPLRERPQDIPVLAKSILQTLGASNVSIEKDTLRLLQGYEWPGNIRELRNVLERAVLLSKGSPLRSKFFPGLKTETSARGPASEVKRIQEAVRRCNGNKKKAAELLGISRVTLYRKLKSNAR